MVKSSLEITEIKCEDLKNEVYQLAIILYPPEEINEAFLLRLRNCVIGLKDDNPLKRWMRWVARRRSYNPKDQKKVDFLTGIISSQFNLITDNKVKTAIIALIHEVPELTLGEKLLKSYLYLMIGNITRSDNILKSVIRSSPFDNWMSVPNPASIYHRIGNDHLEHIIKKLSRHPADRRTFSLFRMYILNFYTDSSLVDIFSKYKTGSLEGKLDLKYIERLAPVFVSYLKLKDSDNSGRIGQLLNIDKYPFEEQSYWFWPFMDIDSLKSERLKSEFERLAKDDPLWFICIMDHEKLIDLHLKNSPMSNLSGRKQILRDGLLHHEKFMLSLFNLIDSGDVSDLTTKTINFITHE